MKSRLDQILVIRGYAPSRSQARLLIFEGKVEVEGQIIDKPGKTFGSSVTLHINSSDDYVGRGAKKIEKALNDFDINVENQVVLDVGASTGGFTDCVLQKGAKKVYAIDVGHDQLAEKLRNNSRVINMEKTNIRTLTSLPELGDIAVVDLSYISLRLVIGNIFSLLKQGGKIIALIKPQFEAGPGIVGKDGVIKDDEIREKIVTDLQEWAAQNKFTFERIIKSPIEGKQGNIEYLALISQM